MSDLELFTGSQLARELALSPPTISRALRDGRLDPDFIAGDMQLFRPARVPEIRAILSGNPRKGAR